MSFVTQRFLRWASFLSQNCQGLSCPLSSADMLPQQGFRVLRFYVTGVARPDDGDGGLVAGRLRALRAAGVVDPDVNAAQALSREVCQRLHRGLLAHVARLRAQQ